MEWVHSLSIVKTASGRELIINAFAAVAFGMIERFLRACRLLLSGFGDHHSILLKNLALRQQLAIYQRMIATAEASMPRSLVLDGP